LWTAKKTNEWVLNKAGVRKELLKTDKAKKLAFYGHTMRKHAVSCSVLSSQKRQDVCLHSL